MTADGRGWKGGLGRGARGGSYPASCREGCCVYVASFIAPFFVCSCRTLHRRKQSSQRWRWRHGRENLKVKTSGYFVEVLVPAELVQVYPLAV